MLMDDPVNTVFIDIMTCFTVCIMLIANFVPVGNSMPANETYPIVNIFLYRDDAGKPYAVMNGFKVSIFELKRNIASYRKEFSVIKNKSKKKYLAVQVITGVDGKIPSSYTTRIFQAAMSLNSRKPGRTFIVTWKQYLLTEKEKRENGHEKKED